MRLQKFMADCGIGSRRTCERLIAEGKVFVDGLSVTEMGVKIDPEKNVVTYEGRIIKPAENSLYIALHKPVGYITSSDDQFGRPTVIDLLKGIDERVFPVGRLDYNSSGLIFLTNDGSFAFKLTHPKHDIYKKYLVRVNGMPSDEAVDALRGGVHLDDGMTLPSKVEYVDKDGHISTLTIAIKEGRNRQVRRMFEAVGHSVVSLHRTAIGGVELGCLKCGEIRFLIDEEIRGLLCLVK